VAPDTLGTPQAEALRYLYTRVKHHENGQRLQTYLFTSPGPAEEMTPILVSLAVVAARAGAKTLLVDSNLRQPALHSLLRCRIAPGLVDVLAEPAGWQKSIQTTHVENLHFIPAGIPSASGVSLESPACDLLLAHCKAAYDIILLVAPAVCSYTDAAVLSAKVDATCLVLIGGVSRLEAISEAKAALEAVHGKVIGAILH
jgi:capsular exopolysaccharide synthesis family protein